jgi:hypothetical protein
MKKLPTIAMATVFALASTFALVARFIQIEG